MKQIKRLKLIKNKTKLKFTNTKSGEVVEGTYIYHDDDGINIRTKDAPKDFEGSDWGLFPYGIEIGLWTVKVK